MQMGTLDAMAGEGRVIVGLGLSGPQIVEGWYGQPWGRPYYRLRDTVEIIRKVFRREAPVEHQGKEIQLPYQGPGAMGIGKPLRSILHMNPDIPIFLGTGNETNVKLTAEIADGWIPMGFVPGMMDVYRPWLEEGFRRAGGGKSLEDFEIQAQSTVIVTDDIRKALDAMKPTVALYGGGMGHKNVNFHKDQMTRRGFGEAAERIQELFLAGRRQEAVDAVPDEYVDEGALVGPKQRIAERFARWRDSGATGLTLHTLDRDAIDLVSSLSV